ncbi:M23 family metallopeptidase [Desulfitibacter alkalitolerans]|uniref:M23 family metallopeptidase n=1 Tax=Desulfitibacter alkalitolerans TaxID=264641 RepID=UPI00048840A2|nr:M23 family metallopeptidase [Desulfitibacter alkalitolerans]
MKKGIGLFLICILTPTLLLFPIKDVRADDYMEKFKYTGPYYGSYTLYAPFRTSGGANDYNTITSKYNNPRRATSSHGGVDFQAQLARDVYSIARGIVRSVNDIIDSKPFGYYVVVQLDINGNGSYDNVYARYVHLSRIDVNVGDIVWTTTRLGRSGNTGADSYNQSPSSSALRSLPWEKYYSNIAAWKYGQELDFISDYYNSGRTFYVACYGKSGSTKIAAQEVVMYVRLHNSSNDFTMYNMVHLGSDKYSVTIPTGDFPNGTRVEFFFRGRPNTTTTYHHGFYPAKFASPPIPPDKTKAWHMYNKIL